MYIEYIRSVVSWLRKHPRAVITAEFTVTGWVLSVTNVQAPDYVLLALAALSAMLGLVKTLSLLSRDNPVRANKQGNLKGGLNVDASLNYAELEGANR